MLLHAANNQQMILSDYIIEEFLDFARDTIPKTPQKMQRLMRQTLEEFAESYEPHDAVVRDVNDVDIMQLAIQHDAIILTSDKDILEHAMGATPLALTVADYRALF